MDFKDNFQKKKLRVIISGGGTGGHIFPAVAIAKSMKKIADIEVLFIGSRNRMEMEIIPQLGYNIIGLPIRGFNRKKILVNIKTIVLLIMSLFKSFSIIRSFKPDLLIGVGGFASFPVLFVGRIKKIPIYLQEQNSFAGLANKMLAKSARKIYTAYKGMEKYFPQESIILFGNPISYNIEEFEIEKTKALQHFNLNPSMKTILVSGGSLGAKSINEAVAKNHEEIISENIQILWQTGKAYYSKYKTSIQNENIHITEFIDNMNYAYKVADLVVARAGALTISELCVTGTPSLLIPSPNVAEDHQTKNAVYMKNIGAADYIADNLASEILPEKIKTILNNDKEIEAMRRNAKKNGYPNAGDDIAKDILCDIKK